LPAAAFSPFSLGKAATGNVRQNRTASPPLMHDFILAIGKYLLLEKSEMVYDPTAGRERLVFFSRPLEA
jgi:hypothetical protein